MKTRYVRPGNVARLENEGWKRSTKVPDRATMRRAVAKGDLVLMEKPEPKKEKAKPKAKPKAIKKKPPKKALAKKVAKK